MINHILNAFCQSLKALKSGNFYKTIDLLKIEVLTELFNEYVGYSGFKKIEVIIHVYVSIDTD